MIAQAHFTITDLSDATAEVIVGTQTAATNAWKGSATFTELKDGQTILYWLPFAGTSTAATLELTLPDGTTSGAAPVYINGTTRCTTHVAVGNVTQMTYRVNTPINGSTAKYTGWWITRNQDTTTNYYDRMQYKASVTATGAIAAGRLGVFNSAGKLILLSTAAFDVTKPILYIGTAYATGKLTQTDNYISWGTEFSLENTVSGFSGTAGATVYIRGTLNGNMFTPASGVLTTTAPITEDGYTYILLGLMSTTTAAVLAPEHPMFRYYNGGFKTISQISYEAFLTAEEAQEAIDALAVGGRNYILNSGSEVATSTAQIARYALSEPMIAGEQYTVSLTLTPMEEYAGLTVRTSEGSTTLATIGLSGTERQTVRATFIAEYAQGKSPDDAPDNADILIYRKPASAGTATTIIHQIKLENPVYLWQYQRYDWNECRRVRFMDSRADAGFGDPGRHQRLLHHHLSELQRRRADGHENLRADAESASYCRSVHFIRDGQRRQQHGGCKDRRVCENAQYAVG